MCIEIGELSEPLDIVAAQVRFIKMQEDDDIPLKRTKIRCPCMRLVLLKYAYRCLYCSIFYCRECAEEHFGKTVAQYKKEQEIKEKESC